MENTNEQSEVVLYEESDKEEERIEQSESEIEVISDEDYLLECARYGEIENLKDLFEENKNLDVNYQDARKHTALHMASANGHLDIVVYLVDSLKCNPNLQNYAGNTPLHWAALNGQKEVVTYLLTKEVDILIKNNLNKVAAEEAYDKQYFDVSELIVDKEIEMRKGEKEENGEFDDKLEDVDLESIDINK